MSAFSPYFEAYFRNTNSDTTNQTIDLPGLSETSVKKLVEFAYTGQLEMKFDSEFIRLFQAADFLCLESVCAACREYLIDILEPANCFEVLQIATQFDLDEFRTRVKEYILEHFQQIIDCGDGVLSADSGVISEFLQDDNLLVTEKDFLTTPDRQEEILLNFVFKYVNFSSCPKLLPQFLENGVRLPLMMKTALLVHEEAPADQSIRGVPDLGQPSDQCATVNKRWQEGKVDFA